MPLKDLDRGEKTEIHLRLYESQMEILDALAERFKTSRAMILGKLLEEYAERNPEHLAPTP